MAHPAQLKFAEIISTHFKTDSLENLKIIEIGSYIVNDSIRKFFNGAKEYVGVDLMPGPGVDWVGGGDAAPFGNESFDISISCECFEHNPNWVATMKNMHRMTKKGGLVVVSCASRGRLEHGTKRTEPKESPGTQSLDWDYYKNLNKKDFLKSLNDPVKNSV